MLRLPLSKLWGAGEKTQDEIPRARHPERRSAGLFRRGPAVVACGSAGGAFLYAAARGRDLGTMGRDSVAAGEPATRSMSAETTFERDCSDRECVEDVLMHLSTELAYRLWSEDCKSRTLVLKLRLHDFTTTSRRMSRPSYYLSSDDAFKDALALLEKAWDGRTEIRLLGLGFAALEKGGAVAQGELFTDDDFTADEGRFPGRTERQRKAEGAVFEIERRGLGKVTRARLLGRDDRGRDATAQGLQPEDGKPTP